MIIGKQFAVSENYRKILEMIESKGIKLCVVGAGQRIFIEKNVYFDVLWPSDEESIGENILNNNSMVCKMVYRDFSILFTGDVEAIAEKAILEKYERVNLLQSTVLKVAHHGSKSSSILEFLQVVSPKIALIGVGERNTFGHPNEGILDRLSKIGCEIFRTDEIGEIVIEVDRKGEIKIESMIKDE